jgi:hypothetical protein
LQVILATETSIVCKYCKSGIVRIVLRLHVH